MENGVNWAGGRPWSSAQCSGQAKEGGGRAVAPGTERGVGDRGGWSRVQWARRGDVETKRRLSGKGPKMREAGRTCAAQEHLGHLCCPQ